MPHGVMALEFGSHIRHVTHEKRHLLEDEVVCTVARISSVRGSDPRETTHDGQARGIVLRGLHFEAMLRGEREREGEGGCRVQKGLKRAIGTSILLGGVGKLGGGFDDTFRSSCSSLRLRSARRASGTASSLKDFPPAMRDRTQCDFNASSKTSAPPMSASERDEQISVSAMFT